MIAYIVIMLLLNIAGCYALRKNINFELSDNIKTIIIGNSMGECALNDSLLPSYKNMCSSGIGYLSAYSSLYYFLEKNASIDTVIITVGIPSFMLYKNNYYSSLKYMRQFRNYAFCSSVDEWKWYLHSTGFYKSLCSFSLYDYLSCTAPKWGGYIYLNRHKLTDPRSAEDFEKCQQERKGHGYSADYIRENSSIQIMYLQKIIELCENKNVTAVLMNTPTYNLSRYASDKGYKEVLSTLLGDNIFVADYSNMQFPDTIYYGDITHLNHLGAAYFSNFIRENGLDLQSVKDYCIK